VSCACIICQQANHSYSQLRSSWALNEGGGQQCLSTCIGDAVCVIAELPTSASGVIADGIEAMELEDSKRSLARLANGGIPFLYNCQLAHQAATV
jgi:hypothetical protein